MGLLLLIEQLALILPHDSCSELSTASEFLEQAFPGSGALNGVDDAACNSSIPQLGALQREVDKKMCDALLKEKIGKLHVTRVYEMAAEASSLFLKFALEDAEKIAQGKSAATAALKVHFLRTSLLPFT